MTTTKLYKYKLTSEQVFICLISIVLMAISNQANNYFYLIIDLPFLIYLVYLKTSIHQWIIMMLIFFIYCLLIYLININLNLRYINSLLLNKTSFYSLRLKLMTSINNHYEPMDSSFIKLLLFNFKDQNSYLLQQKINNLDIGFLFVVSGFHVSLLLNICKWIFFRKRFKFLIPWFNLLIAFLYGYFLGYTIGILRIVFNNCLSLIFKKMNSFNLNLFSALIIGLMFIKELVNFGYLMTYMCTLYIIYLSTYLKDHKVLMTLLINVGCIILTAPLIIFMNKKINLFCLFLNYIYSLIIPFLYFYLLICFSIPACYQLNTGIINGILNFISINLSISIYLYLTDISQYYIGLYYLVFGSCISIGLIYKNKKR